VRSYTSVTRDRGVTTIPVDLRETAAVEAETALTWVEIEPRLWLVGPASRHPEAVAEAVAAALLNEQSPFPKLMRGLVAGDVPMRAGRGIRRSGRRVAAPALSEEQMIALGAPDAMPQRRRGRA